MTKKQGSLSDVIIEEWKEIGDSIDDEALKEQVNERIADIESVENDSLENTEDNDE